MESERKPWKDWFDKSAASALAAQIASAWPEFDRRRFIRRATRALSALEFSGRVQQISDALRETLPDDIPRALEILSASLPAPLPDCEAVTDGYLQWPLGQFIADHALAYPEESMQAMIELTQRFSAEFAVRPFVERYPELVFKHLLRLTSHPSPHVRRWCSEGLRPHLPWGRKLQSLSEDPTPLWPILDALYRDEELYVRRSVANNLNDIARNHSSQVIRRCRQWLRSGDDNTDWLVRHALRSLIKAGNAQALGVVGYKTPQNIRATLAIKPARISPGESVELTATLSSSHSRRQQLMIDYIVHFVRKNGSSSAKVFKWTTRELAAGEQLEIRKKQSLRPSGARSLYAGVHRVEVQINGRRLAENKFVLRPAQADD